MIKVGVIGATGYTGLELVRWLRFHTQVDIAYISSERYAGRRLSEVFPAFQGLVDLVCEELEPERAAERADFFFIALPHGISQAAVPALLDQGKRVVDLSADFRLKEPEVYEKYYGPHRAAALLKEAVYGLPEIYAGAIGEARLVANPGCYPTAAILALAPLLKNGWVNPGEIIVDAKSGVSGAGRGVSLATHFCEANEDCRAYNIAGHRHAPEMQQELSQLAGLPVTLTFVPHLVPMNRGLLATVYASGNGRASLEEMEELFRGFYHDAPFVRILPLGVYPSTAAVRCSNFCDLGLFADQSSGRIIVLACLDNLGKGAASQAIQNFNIMQGFPEGLGLLSAPCFP